MQTLSTVWTLRHGPLVVTIRRDDAGLTIEADGFRAAGVSPRQMLGILRHKLKFNNDALLDVLAMTTPTLHQTTRATLAADSLIEGAELWQPIPGVAEREARAAAAHQYVADRQHDTDLEFWEICQAVGDTVTVIETLDDEGNAEHNARGYASREGGHFFVRRKESK